MLTSVRRRRLVLVTVGILAAVGGGVAVAASTKGADTHGRVSALASVDDNSTGTCAGNEPARKCEAQKQLGITTSSWTTATADPDATYAPTPYASPAMEPCSESFFAADTAAALDKQFGSTQCFMFKGTSRWILVGDGMSTTSTAIPPDASPGGAMLATLDCGDVAACLDAKAPHSFGDFTVEYPPEPSGGRTVLQTSYGGVLLQLSVSDCGLFVFDVRDSTWHHGLSADVELLMQGKSDPVVGAPKAVDGDTALMAAAPAAVRTRCN